jgi:hypothetical protein
MSSGNIWTRRPCQQVPLQHPAQPALPAAAAAAAGARPAAAQGNCAGAQDATTSQAPLIPSCFPNPSSAAHRRDAVMSAPCMHALKRVLTRPRACLNRTQAAGMDLSPMTEPADDEDMPLASSSPAAAAGTRCASPQPRLGIPLSPGRNSQGDKPCHDTQTAAPVCGPVGGQVCYWPFPFHRHTLGVLLLSTEATVREHKVRQTFPVHAALGSGRSRRSCTRAAGGDARQW